MKIHDSYVSTNKSIMSLLKDKWDCWCEGHCSWWPGNNQGSVLVYNDWI